MNHKFEGTRSPSALKVYDGQLRYSSDNMNFKNIDSKFHQQKGLDGQEGGPHSEQNQAQQATRDIILLK
jgi:hypothetical protein